MFPIAETVKLPILVSTIPLFLLLCRTARVHAQESDPYLACLWEIPEPNAGWPPGYESEAIYYDNYDLCSIYGSQGVMESPPHEPYGNLGCECTAANGDFLCLQDRADPNLWPPRTLNNGMTFVQWCQNQCRCTTRRVAAIAQDNLPISFSENFPQTNGVQPFDFDDPVGGGNPYGTANPHPNIPTGTNTTSGQGGNNNATCAAAPATCASHDACNHTSQCLCKVVGTQVIPGQGEAFKYIAGCVFSPGGKMARKEELPCPCNSTYVSHACCDAAEIGLVWEAPEFKLGELVSDPEQEVL